MSSNGPSGVSVPEGTPRSDIIGPTETGKPETVLEVIKCKFRDAKIYISEHKRAFANIGQIGGVATLVAGGASLIFSGLAANLTLAGLPLGIPLMIGGGVLLLAGTALQVAHHIEQNNLALGEKLKNVLKETLSNLVLGAVMGSALVAFFSITSLTNLMTIITVAIKLKPFLQADINSKQSWAESREALKDAFGKNPLKKSSLEKALDESESFADFIKKLTQYIPEKAKDFVELFDRNTSEIFAGLDIFTQTTSMQAI